MHLCSLGPFPDTLQLPVVGPRNLYVSAVGVCDNINTIVRIVRSGELPAGVEFVECD